MKKLTVAERRERQLERFNANYINDMDKARYILNSYYRYVALYNRVVEMDNDSRYYNSRYHLREQDKEQRWHKRLSEILKPYGITIYIPWSLPFLGIKDDSNGCIKESVIDPILYN